MPSPRRLEKLNSLLKEELSRIIDRDFDFFGEALVTVTRVLVSPDGHYATIFISVFAKNPKHAIDRLSKSVYSIQQILNHRMRMRPVPKIHFEIDEEEQKREIIEQSLAELKKKGEV